MTKSEDYRQLKAYSRQDGLLMGLLWLLSFACFAFIYRMPALSLLFDVMIISIPFTLFFLTRRYRDNVVKARFSFRRGFAYSFCICFYATLILALGQWLYFQYLDGGQFIEGMQEMLDREEYKEALATSGVDSSMFTEALGMLKESRPIDIAISFISQNIFVSLILSAIIGLICQKTTPKY